MIWKVPKMWDGGKCWIIGGGLSMPYQFKVPPEIIHDVCLGKLTLASYSPFMEPIHGAHVIGVNNAYQIGEWIDILFFGDGSWYLAHRRKLAGWPGIRVTCTPRFGNRPKEAMEGVKYVRKNRGKTKGLTFDMSKISWNGNSGASAINLAVLLGAKTICLLGFDMNTYYGERLKTKIPFTHHHGNHGKAVRKPPYKRQLMGFPIISKDAEKMGVAIYNVNHKSAIQDFPKISLAEALDV
jgi:hypothetical protein